MPAVAKWWFWWRGLKTKPLLDTVTLTVVDVMTQDHKFAKRHKVLFNSDEKQLTRLFFISQFISDYILRPTNGGRLLWWWAGTACRDRNDHQPLGSSYASDTALFSHEWHIFYSGCLYSFASFLKWLDVMFLLTATLFMCGYSGQQCCVKDASYNSVLTFEIDNSQTSEGAG